MNTREERAAKRSQVSRMTNVSKRRSTGHAQAWSPGFHRLEGGRQGRVKYCASTVNRYWGRSQKTVGR